MSNINKRLRFVLAMLLIWLLPLPVLAQDAGFRVYAEADRDTYQIGDTLTVTLWLERTDTTDAYLLYNFEDWLIYDKNALEFRGCTALAKGFRIADELAYNAAYDRLTLRYQLTAPGAEPEAVPTLLQVAKLDFQALQAGQTALFHDAVSVWVQPDGSGSVTVSSPQTSVSINEATKPPGSDTPGGTGGNGGGASGGGAAGGGAAGGVPDEIPVNAPTGEQTDTPDRTSADFSDLKADAWYCEAIDYMTGAGLMNGITEDSFAPGLSLNRGMLATILWRAAGQPTVAVSAPFADVPSTLYCNKAIAWAYSAGAVQGIGNDVYAPGAVVRREQLATILWRLQGEPQCAADLTNFADGGAASAYAVPALCWAVEQGLLLGDDQQRLRPGDSLTRAEAAVLLMRYLEQYAAKDSL